MMHKSDRTPKTKCTDIQDRIYGFIEENNKLDDFPDIAEHIKNCRDCQSFYHSVTSLRNYFLAPPKLGLKADPRIQKNIQNYFELKRHINRRGSKKFADWIQSLFTFRIPVYQAISGFAIILLVLIFLSGVKSRSGFWWMEIDYSGQTEAYENTNLYVLDTLHLLNTSNGQNAMEDSILVGFLESSL